MLKLNKENPLHVYKTNCPQKKCLRGHKSGQLAILLLLKIALFRTEVEINTKLNFRQRGLQTKEGGNRFLRDAWFPQISVMAILVLRGRATFGQLQESLPQARSNETLLLNGFVNTID